MPDLTRVFVAPTGERSCAVLAPYELAQGGVSDRVRALVFGGEDGQVRSARLYAIIPLWSLTEGELGELGELWERC